MKVQINTPHETWEYWRFHIPAHSSQSKLSRSITCSTKFNPDASVRKRTLAVPAQESRNMSSRAHSDCCNWPRKDLDLSLLKTKPRENINILLLHFDFKDGKYNKQTPPKKTHEIVRKRRQLGMRYRECKRKRYRKGEERFHVLFFLICLVCF